MKITHIQTSNFLGARAVDVRLTTPITMFAGKNYAGKSSVQEAIRMALIGESVRVGLKKDYPALISEGEESGFAEVIADGESYSITLPSGKGNGVESASALPYVLDAQRFASLNENDRRLFLFGLMGIKLDGPSVKQRMLVNGCDAAKVEKIAPMLRAGFDAACKEAQTKAREDKAAWRNVTGGETYGEKKAASFKVEKAEVDLSELAEARIKLEAIEKEIEVNTQNLGVMQAKIKQAESQLEKLGALRLQAGMFARIQDKLQRDEVELQQWEQKVEETRQLATGGRKQGLIHDLARQLYDLLSRLEKITTGPSLDKTDPAYAALAKYAEEHGAITSNADHDPEAARKLPEYEKSLHVMQSAVANGRRDMATSNAAAIALKDIEDEQQHTSTDSSEQIAQLRMTIDNLKHDKGNLVMGIRFIEEAQRKAKEAGEVSKKARDLHVSIQQWDRIATCLAPDGIQSEILSEALGSINERLATAANIAQWCRINIGADMRIFAAEEGAWPRPYSLMSESEKWRADAMIAEAVSHISGLRMLVLDRFDVLDATGREDLICWLDDLVAENEIETALIFGTLKGVPANLPPTVSAHWIENGVVGQLKEAA